MHSLHHKHVSVQATWIQTNASPCCFPPALSETHLQQVVQANMLQLCYLIPLYIEKQTLLKTHQIRGIHSKRADNHLLKAALLKCPLQCIQKLEKHRKYRVQSDCISQFQILRRVYFSLTFWTNYLYQDVTIMSIISTSGLFCSPSMNVVGVINKYELKRLIR